MVACASLNKRALDLLVSAVPVVMGHANSGVDNAFQVTRAGNIFSGGTQLITGSSPTISSPTLSGTVAGTPTASGNWTFSGPNGIVVGNNSFGLLSLNDIGGTSTDMLAYVSLQQNGSERGWMGYGLNTDLLTIRNTIGKINLHVEEGVMFNSSATIYQILTNSQTVNPPSLSTGAVWQSILTFAGVVVGDHLIFTVPPSWYIASRMSIYATVVGTNQVGLYISNESGGTMDLASDTVRFTAIKYL